MSKSKKAPAAVVAAPAPESASAPARSIARTIVSRIEALGPDVAGELLDHARALLAAPTAKAVPNAAYVALRDAIKVAAFNRRNAQQPAVASQLSAIAKLVRRQERATRTYAA